MSIGIGGHIRSIDTNSDFIINWAAREFKEEIWCINFKRVIR